MTGWRQRGASRLRPRGLLGPGAVGDPLWAGAAAFDGRRCLARTTIHSVANGQYRPGPLALRLGPTLAAVVRALAAQPDVLLVDAAGLDHPRRAGLAIHLGAMLDIPTVGVTHRPLPAHGGWPAAERGARSALPLDGYHAGYWLRARTDRRPLAVHAAWRTDPDTVVRVVLASCRHRTPLPLRKARRLARDARARSH